MCSIPEGLVEIRSPRSTCCYGIRMILATARGNCDLTVVLTEKAREGCLAPSFFDKERLTMIPALSSRVFPWLPIRYSPPFPPLFFRFPDCRSHRSCFHPVLSCLLRPDLSQLHPESKGTPVTTRSARTEKWRKSHRILWTCYPSLASSKYIGPCSWDTRRRNRVLIYSREQPEGPGSTLFPQVVSSFALLTSLTRTRRPRTRCSGIDGRTCAVKRRALTTGGWGSGSSVSMPVIRPVEEYRKHALNTLRSLCPMANTHRSPCRRFDMIRYIAPTSCLF